MLCAHAELREESVSKVKLWCAVAVAVAVVGGYLFSYLAISAQHKVPGW